MRSLRILLLLALPILFAACASTPESRISRHRSTFDALPSEDQQKIRAGRIDVGFTPEMVEMALGEPARRFYQRTAEGDSEIWIYHDNRPQFSFGFGIGSYGRHSSMGVGVSTTTGGYDPEERVRVEFRNGRVHTIEYRHR